MFENYRSPSWKGMMRREFVTLVKLTSISVCRKIAIYEYTP